ncbi:rod shape-determining protein MreD [Sneathiella glossodoripedis]|uniref:rod shape-determining protein MreD n=1 Tax=Sneathiella glossodoripedis TaxID=418853 RepID=UPI00055F9785|nr:rod shape-determining protein MreD [Sneathiella glossodoripedis]
MTPSISYQLHRILRGSIPFWISLFLIFLSVVPLRITGFATVTPSFLMISVFYWSLHRPYLLPAPVVFLLGLIFDILTGTPMGLTSLMLLVVHGIAVTQRQVFVGKAFVLSWWGFFLIGAGIAVFSWIVACVLELTIIPILPVFIQYGLTVLFFPLLAWCFAVVQSSILKHI